MAWPESLGFGIDLGRKLPDPTWPCPRAGSTGHDRSLASQGISLRLKSAERPRAPSVGTTHSPALVAPRDVPSRCTGNTPGTGDVARDRAGRRRGSRPSPHAASPTSHWSRARLSGLPGGTRGASLTPCPRGPASIQRALFHLKRQGLMTQRIGIDEERHATPNLETYFSSQSLILLRLSSSGGKAELETQRLFIPAPPRFSRRGPGRLGTCRLPPWACGEVAPPPPGRSGPCSESRSYRGAGSRARSLQGSALPALRRAG